MNYKRAESKEEVYDSTELIYITLLKPFGFAKTVMEELKLEGEEHHFIAKTNEGIVVGSMVVVINDNDVELRHGAVLDTHRNKGIGRQLWEIVRNFLSEQNIKEIELYARNTALKFWKGLGFFETSDWLEHELFTKHGIRYKKMKYMI